MCLVAQACPTLCDLMDCSPPGSSVHGIFQARILQWVAISYLGDLPFPGIEPDTWVSCIGRQILYHCANWEAPILHLILAKRPRSIDISCCNSENWPQRSENKVTLKLKTNCILNSQDKAGQTTKAQFQNDCQG